MLKTTLAVVLLSLPSASPPGDLEDTAVALGGDTADRAPDVGDAAPALDLHRPPSKAISAASGVEPSPIRLDFNIADQRPTILAFGSYT